MAMAHCGNVMQCAQSKCSRELYLLKCRVLKQNTVVTGTVNHEELIMTDLVKVHLEFIIIISIENWISAWASFL